MTSRRIAMLLLASALGVLPASAQTAPDTAPKRPAAPGKAHARTPHAKKAAKTVDRAGAGAAARSPLLGSGDEAASLERRRKAFFAPTPDAGGPEPDAPSAGVTLGGSGGISPGMGFKF